MIWVAGQKQDAVDVALISGADAWVADEHVRDYWSTKELQRHKTGLTDHLGHAPGPAAGIWLRFSDEGTNLIGEQHDHVRLLDLVGPLGIVSFKDETLIADRLTDGSHVQAVYLNEVGDFFLARGLRVENRTLHVFGADALYPRVAHPLPEAVECLSGRRPLTDMVGAFGVVARVALQFLWAHAKDLAEGRSSIVLPDDLPRSMSVGDAERRLGALVAVHSAVLDPFFADLDKGSSLTDKVTADTHPAFPALRALAETGLDLMNRRSVNDPALDAAQKTALGSMRRNTPQAHATMFRRWRDLHLIKALVAAVDSGTRYMCVGAAHLEYMVTAGAVPEGVHLYDLCPEETRRPALVRDDVETLGHMKAHTEQLRVKA